MPASPERRFSLGERRRMPWWIWGTVILLPVAAILIYIFHAPGSSVPNQGAHNTATALGEHGSPHAVSDGAIGDPLMGSATDPAPRHVVSPTSTDAGGVAAVPTVPHDSPTVIATLAARTDTPPPNPDPLRPHYGNGQLWVRPLPMSPRELTEALTGRSDKEIDDSIVTKLVQTYINDMAEEAKENPRGLPSWTTKVGGKTVGLDQKWIYLGPIKVPAALLALLPIKNGGNLSYYQFNKQLQSMRDDLYEAARRSATYDDFKDAVRELRTQTQDARDFQKAQRTAPDSGKGG